MVFKSLKRATLGAIVADAIALPLTDAQACTIFRLQAGDGAWIVGRA